MIVHFLHIQDYPSLSPPCLGTVMRSWTLQRIGEGASVGTLAVGVLIAVLSVPGEAQLPSPAVQEGPQSPLVEGVLSLMGGGAASGWWTGGAVSGYRQGNSHPASRRWPHHTITRTTAVALVLG